MSGIDASQDPLIQSKVLIESLPYLREFHGEIVVIKYGGHAMKDAKLQQAFAQNIALLNLVGIHPVIVHGGGPQIGQMLEKFNIESRFKNGQRVTDSVTMDIVEMVLVGKVNQEIVTNLNVAGVRAVGLSGKDALLLKARQLEMVASNDDSTPPEIINLGQVGEVTHVNVDLLLTLQQRGFVPVIAPIGVDNNGTTFNINADAVAGAVAGALEAKRLLLLTDVAGILDKTGTLIHSITPQEAAQLFTNGTLTGGMIPKVQCCLEALAEGVEKAMIIDGRTENSVLLELLTDKGIGTEIINTSYL